MKKCIALFVIFTNTHIFSIDEVSLMGICGSAHITQQICDNLADLKTYEMLGTTNEYTKIIKKTTEKRAKKYCINTDYPLSPAELKQARNNIIKELNKLETYENAQPNSYKSTIAYYKKAIDAYDKAIFNLEKAPQTCSAFLAHSLQRIQNAVETKIAQLDLINKAPARIIKKVEDANIADMIKHTALKYVHNEADLRFLVCHFNLDL